MSVKCDNPEVEHPGFPCNHGMRQCKCGCRAQVKNNYAPGHDARHVKAYVTRSLRARIDGRIGEDLEVWMAAVGNLPTEALRGKYRSQMRRSVVRYNLASIWSVEELAERQGLGSQMIGIIRSIDPEAAALLGQYHTWRTVAEILVAMGWTRYSILRRLS